MGISVETSQDELNPINVLLEYARSDDNSLIQLYKTGGQDKHIIPRILFGRNSKNVGTFFELYKNILNK
jgi:hypothetical protein